MKTRYLLILTVVPILPSLASFAAEPTPEAPRRTWNSPAIHVSYTPIRQSNQCLADAVGFQTTLLIQYPNSWSRILKVTWKYPVNRQYTSHAYCVYELNRQLYAYDSVGGQRRLSCDPTLKYDSDAIGLFLGQSNYQSAKYLTAFDPANLDLPILSSVPMEEPNRVGLRPGDF